MAGDLNSAALTLSFKELWCSRAGEEQQLSALL